MEVNLSDEHNNILSYFVIAQLFMQQSRTFLSDGAMNKYMRYENHLDKKFEKTLAMFFKLREIRNNGGLTKSVL